MKTGVLRSILVLLLTFSLSLAVITPVEAQCPMCRMTAESNLANGGVEGRGLNNGILYMLATPYLLIGAIGYAWYRNRKKFDVVEEEQEG